MTFAKARLFQLAAVLTYLCASVAGGEFRPSCVTTSCPSVRWTDATAGQTTAFVLTSSKRASATNNWVSFAFADGPGMLQAQLVIDCYDVGGNSAVGTSKNVRGSTTLFDNKDSPADLSKLANRTARIDQGVYNCSFLMALPSASAYVILAEGSMDPLSSAAPKKAYHSGRKWISNAVYGFSLPAVAMTSATVVTSVKSASSLSSTTSAVTTTFSTLTTVATYNSTNENISTSMESSTIHISMNMSVTPAPSETSSKASTSQVYGTSTMKAPSAIIDGVQTIVDTPKNKSMASTKGKESGADRVHQSWLVAVAVLSALVVAQPLVGGR